MISCRTSINFIKFTCNKIVNINKRLSHSTLTQEVIRRKGKIFIEYENEYAHKIISNLQPYKRTTYIPDYEQYNIAIETSVEISNGDDINWETLPINEICNKFKQVSLVANLNSLPLESECFNQMSISLAKRCSDLSDEQLFTLLKYLSLWPFGNSPKENNYYRIWKALDSACISKWRTWDLNKILLCTDLWYNINLTRMSDFVFISINKIAKNPTRFSSHQLVQILFYLNVLRTPSKAVSLCNLENRLEDVVHQLSIEEIGVAVMGFFKTQNVLYSEKLTNYLIDRIIREKETIPDITLACLLKALRLSLKIAQWARVPELMDTLETILERLSLQCSIHINLLSAKALTFHEATLTKIPHKLNNCIQTARLKDMEKVMFPLTLLNVNVEKSPIFKSIADELEDTNRISECEQYPKCFVAIVYYLTLKDIFVESAVAKVLNMDFIRRTYGKTNYVIGREILGIDTYVNIMYPNYKGPKLPEDVRNYLSKRYSTFLPDAKRKIPKHSQLIFDIFEIAQEIFGTSGVTYKYVLPHSSRADIVFHLGSNNEILPIPDYYKQIEDFTGPISAPKDGKWFTLTAASRNMFLHNAPIVTGETSSKLQLLKALGYKPITVSFLDWPKSTEEKLTFLRKLIFS